MEGNALFCRVIRKCFDREVPIFGWLSTSNLEEVFKFSCLKCCEDILGILGSDFLYPTLPRLIMSSHVVSLFLTYVMDIISDCDVAVGILDRVIRYNAVDRPVILEELRTYDLSRGVAPVGGVFSNWMLRRDIRFISFLSNLKSLVLTRDLGPLDDILWNYRDIMSIEEASLIREKAVFISDLLLHGHVVPCSVQTRDRAGFPVAFQEQGSSNVFQIDNPMARLHLYDDDDPTTMDWEPVL